MRCKIAILCNVDILQFFANFVSKFYIRQNNSFGIILKTSSKTKTLSFVYCKIGVVGPVINGVEDIDVKLLFKLFKIKCFCLPHF